jgi:hypothetical protein
MISQKFDIGILLLFLLIIFLILSILYPIFIIGAIGVSFLNIYHSRVFIPLSLLLLLPLALHGDFYTISIILLLAIILFNLYKSLTKFTPNK